MNGIIAACEERNLKGFENERAVLAIFAGPSAVIGKRFSGASGEPARSQRRQETSIPGPRSFIH